MKTLKCIILGSLLLGLASCGGSGETDVEDSTNTEVEKNETTPDIPKEEVSLRVSAVGNTIPEIHFQPDLLTVPANSHVTLTLTNQSIGDAMLHNWLLINMGTGQEVVEDAAEAGIPKNYIPENPNVLEYTTIVEPGDSITIEFDAPPKDSYHYICTYPGHYPNMLGRFNVE